MNNDKREQIRKEMEVAAYLRVAGIKERILRDIFVKAAWGFVIGVALRIAWTQLSQ